MTTPTEAGPCVFEDAIGAPPVRLQVVNDGGELVARFPAADDDQGCDVPVDDMLGDWSPAT